MNKTTQLGVRVSTDFKRELKKIAAKDGRTVSNFVIKVLADVLAKERKGAAS